jgi:hypothetical protein
MNAEILPRRFGEVDAVVLRCLLDVCKCKRAVGFRNADHLIEPSNRVAYVASIGKGLFSLFRKRVDAVGQIALPR